MSLTTDNLLIAFNSGQASIEAVMLWVLTLPDAEDEEVNDA